MALFNNNLSYSPPQEDPQARKQAVYDYLMKKKDTGFIPAQGNEGLNQKLSMQTKGDQIAITPIEARLSEIASNPNRQTSITDAIDYSRTAPSIDKKTDINSVSPQEKKAVVQNYVKSKMEPKKDESKPTEAKKDEGSDIDWSYVMQGISALGGAVSAGSGGSANQMGIAQSFDGMRDSRDAKIEQAKLNDPNNEKAVEYRDFIKNNFNPKLLKDVDLNKMSLSDMQGMYGQIKDREQTDLQRQMMYSKMNAGSKPSAKMREEEAEVKSFKDSLREYQKSVKDIGMIDLSGEGKARAESQRANLLLKLKNLEKSGALDQGMIDIANQLLPEASYTRDGKVDAKINSYVDTIDRNYMNNAKAQGYQPQMYQSEAQLKRRAESEANGESLMRHPKTGKMYRVKNGQVIGEA